MTIICLVGSKGGVGSSLIATNLGCALAKGGSTLLIDLHAGSGVDDLLIDVSGEKSWQDLIVVLDELQSKHIKLVTVAHSSGLKLIPSPEGWTPLSDQVDLEKMVQSLARSFDWCLLDLDVGMSARNQRLYSISDAILLVTSADPPALRSARRFVSALDPDTTARLGLVINQINRQHPSTPSQLAESLDVPLLAALPPDPRAVGYQIHFGRPCVLDNSSPFGSGIRRLASRLQKSVYQISKSANEAAILHSDRSEDSP